MSRLILRPGKLDEQVFELGDGEHTIGRTKQNHIFVLHKSLSRHHARIVIERDGARIEDLGSKNGTFVDGVRVDRRALHAAHYIKCGDVVFSWVDDARSNDARAPSEPPGAFPTMVCGLDSDPARRSLAELLTRYSDGDRRAPCAAATAGGAAASGAPAERAAARLEILLKVSELLSSPGHIDEVLGRVLDLALRVLDIDRGTVLLLDDDGVPQPRVTRTRAPRQDDEQIFSRHIVRYVMTHGVAALFADAPADPRLAQAGSILQQSICASMCAPLKPRDDRPPLGVLYVDNITRADRFQQDDLEFLSAFANQSAIAIDNALLSARLAEAAVTKSALLRFFPPAAIEAIMHQGARLDAVETDATALFCDISGYTELSSQLAPREVIALLNAYFPIMSDIVFRHEGTLEKYIGDALLAVWGAPWRRPDDASRAVAAAIEMQRAMRALAERWRADRLRQAGDRGAAPARELAIHIGINSGVVAAGNIGSERFLQYATIGDATNVASRICNAANDGEIVIEESTRRRLPDGAFRTEALGPVSVKGKAEPLRLYRVLWD
jgi:adenylate cyclase